ncbi:MAG: hydrogenase maturation protease [Planctomycetota bacterium]|nr:hydrogenase maturation protease [Planctomycetota bacterium]MDP6506049.1 hydrogenase maturation protease [Planctomycetota bacterium]
MNTPLIIGVGNDFRRDDGVGLAAARKLRDLLGPEARVIERMGEGIDLIDDWDGEQLVILIDAVRSNAAPGDIHCVRPLIEGLPKEHWNCSTHAFSLAGAIEMGKVLGRIPSEMIVYGIEGKDFDEGQGLSPHVERGLGKVVQAVQEYLCSALT